MQTAEVINFRSKVLSPVEAGREAWGRIQTASKMMREDWRLIGEALLVGRRLHASDKLFGQWCREKGYDMDRRVRADAMWIVENWSTVHAVDSSIAHPSHVRIAYNASLTPPSPEPDEDETPAPVTQAPRPAPSPPKPLPSPAPATTSVVPPWEDDEEEAPAPAPAATPAPRHFASVRPPTAPEPDDAGTSAPAPRGRQTPRPADSTQPVEMKWDPYSLAISLCAGTARLALFPEIDAETIATGIASTLDENEADREALLRIRDALNILLND